MRKQLIDSTLYVLKHRLGNIRTPIEAPELEALYAKQDISGMMGVIRDLLLIDTRVRVGMVNSGGPRRAAAWIEYPNPPPPFGSRAFREMTVTIYVRQAFLATSCFEAAVLCFAHEYCHLILDSTGNPLRKSEEAVDLTAMLLGFRDFYVTGCRSDAVRDGRLHEDRVGYLSPEEVMYAARSMT